MNIIPLGISIGLSDVQASGYQGLTTTKIFYTGDRINSGRLKILLRGLE
jgi:hypothetical protein